MIANRYSLDREIGRGGTGAVWLGRDETLGRQVALKRVGVVPGGSEPDLERAAREARLAASLNHPHVVAVFDLVHEEDHQWLVMEYVEGQTLAERIRDAGRLDPGEVAPVLAQAAEALTAAHAAGIVHRDVKPSNILLTESGSAKLTDFGIARAEADAQLTQTGLVTGSPAYLSPEIASGGVATPASDVWSLGATAYHALEGKPPLEVDGNLVGALYRLVHEDPPQATQPGWLAPLLAGTMVKDPAQRWTMAEVLRFLTDRTVPATPPVTGASEPTAVLPVAAAAAEPVGLATAVAPAPEAEERVSRRTPLVPFWAIAAVIGVVLLLVLAVILATHGSSDKTPPVVGPTKHSSSSTPTSSPSQSGSPSAPTHTVAELRTFIENYLALAPSDPEAAFQELTPQFQSESGGISGYRGFWDTVESAHLDTFSADPRALTVSYDVTYTVLDSGGDKGKGKGKGHTRTSRDHTTLQLVDQNGTLLISGEG